MKVPQPIQYQGSKRKLASAILNHLPSEIERLVEPFAGSAAISVAAASHKLVNTFWLNDLNVPLIGLLEMMVKKPDDISTFYKHLWLEQFTFDAGFVEHYYDVRQRFNQSRDARLFLYLLARCVKGAVRYNSEGNFNQSPDKRRHGTRPDSMRQNIFAFSRLLFGRTIFSVLDYADVLDQVAPSDLVYMDPPYQGVCGDRDSRYFAQINFPEFIDALHKLNRRGIPFLLSYDGKRGNQQFGEALPEDLRLTRVELNAGRSSQATLLGRDEITIESLYFSPGLIKLSPKLPRQMPLLESYA